MTPRQREAVIRPGHRRMPAVMKAADPRTRIWRYGAESFHHCESSRSVIGTRHRDANTPAVMLGRDSCDIAG
jgi:hypothetical protein